MPKDFNFPDEYNDYLAEVEGVIYALMEVKMGISDSTVQERLTRQLEETRKKNVTLINANKITKEKYIRNIEEQANLNNPMNLNREGRDESIGRAVNLINNDSRRMPVEIKNYNKVEGVEIEKVKRAGGYCDSSVRNLYFQNCLMNI